MLKKLLLASLLVLFLTTPVVAEEKVLVNGIDGNFPPFAFVGSDGKATGFDVDAMEWIAKEMGFKVKHQPMEWAGIVPSLKDKKIDMISSGLSVNPQRKEQIAFSKPYWIITQVIIVAKDSKLTTEEVLTGGYKIGVQVGTSDAKALEDLNGKDGRKYTIVNYKSLSLAGRDVVNGRIDAAVMNDAPAYDTASKLEVKVIGLAGLPDEEFAVGINKENTELLKTINDGLDKLMADPYWDELVKKYNPSGIEAEDTAALSEEEK